MAKKALINKQQGRTKFAVREPESEDRIWWGPVNQELSIEHYEGLRAKVAAHLGRLDALYVVDAFAGADPAHRLSVRVVTSMQTRYGRARSMRPIRRTCRAGTTVDLVVVSSPELGCATRRIEGQSPGAR